MQTKTKTALLLALAFGGACGEPPDPHEVIPQNILLIVADDLGVDRVAVYREHPDPGRTPRIDQLAARGVLFRNAWANPVCSPTRATILTGKYCSKTGVGHYVSQFKPLAGLDTTKHTTIAQLLQATHRTGAVGKWHLASSTDPNRASHPNRSGFDYYAGSLYNLFGLQESCEGGAQKTRQSYYSWTKTRQGSSTPCHAVYATTDTTDEAIAFIDRAGQDPWFLYVAYNAPHTPFHRPPDDLHSYEKELDAHAVVAGNEPLYMKAMTEAMDTQIGRLLDHIRSPLRDRTTVIFVGDNGTTGLATTPPFDPARAKTTVYEGGLNVPLIIAGPAVDAGARGAECAALVNTTDLFRTIADLAGVSTEPRDSVGLLDYLADPTLKSKRDMAYAELFQENGPGPYRVYNQAARGPRYKAIRRWSRSAGTQLRFFDLLADPFEKHDLLDDNEMQLTPEQRLEFQRLTTAFD